MKKSSGIYWISLVVLAGFVMVSACATLPQAKPGLYVNKDLRFSINYPDNWQLQKLMTKDEVLRVANPNQWKIPVLNVNITDKTKGAQLKNAAKGWIESTKKNFPKSKRFKVFSQEMIKLEDGTSAAAFTLKWTWIDGQTKLQSASVMAYKKNKVVTATSTTVLGGPTTPDKLLAICKTLKFH